MAGRGSGAGYPPAPCSYWATDPNMERMSNRELWTEFHTAGRNIRGKQDALREMARRVGRRLQLATARGMSAELYEREVQTVLDTFLHERVWGEGLRSDEGMRRLPRPRMGELSEERRLIWTERRL